MSYSDSETGNPVYNRPDSPYYDSGEPDADERELGGPGISARLLQGVLAWGDESLAEDENISFNASLTKGFDSGYARLDFLLWNQDRKEVYYDAADSGKKIYERETEAEDNNWSLRGEAAFDLSRHRVEVGGETRHYGWGDQTVNYMDESYFNASVNFFAFIREGFKGEPECLTYHALYAQDTWKIHPRADLEFGLRQEWYEADSIDPEAFGYEWPAEETSVSENNLDPRFALTFRPWDTGAFTARAGIVHRYPSSPEYFWWYLNKGMNFFNEDFRPEEAKQYELTYQQSFSDVMMAEIRGYYYDVEDYISSTSVPKIGSVYYNISEVEIKGMEIELSANLSSDMRIWTNFTWQEGDKSGDPWDTDNNLTHELADLPETMFNMGADYVYGEKFSAHLSLNYTDSREHFKGAELVTLDSYTLVNCSASYRFWESKGNSWELLFAAENILDEDYEEEEGYPMAGTTVMGGLRAIF